MKRITISFLLVFASLMLLQAQSSGETKPDWISKPQKYGLTEYAPGWIYEVVVSPEAANEKTARTRALEIVRFEVAAKIASEIEAGIAQNEFDTFTSAGISNSREVISKAIGTYIQTMIPRYETLEWYIENGKKNGKNYQRAYVFVRFKISDILGVLDKVDPDKIIKNVIKDADLDDDAISDQARKEFMNNFRNNMKDTKKTYSDRAN